MDKGGWDASVNYLAPLVQHKSIIAVGTMLCNITVAALIMSGLPSAQIIIVCPKAVSN